MPGPLFWDLPTPPRTVDFGTPPHRSNHGLLLPLGGAELKKLPAQRAGGRRPAALPFTVTLECGHSTQCRARRRRAQAAGSRHSGRAHTSVSEKGGRRLPHIPCSTAVHRPCSPQGPRPLDGCGPPQGSAWCPKRQGWWEGSVSMQDKRYNEHPQAVPLRVYFPGLKTEYYK